MSFPAEELLFPDELLRLDELFLPEVLLLLSLLLEFAESTEFLELPELLSSSKDKIGVLLEKELDFDELSELFFEESDGFEELEEFNKSDSLSLSPFEESFLCEESSTVSEPLSAI